MSYYGLPGSQQLGRGGERPGDSCGKKSWSAEEFQKRRGAFENAVSEEAEEQALYNEEYTNHG